MGLIPFQLFCSISHSFSLTCWSRWISTHGSLPVVLTHMGLLPISVDSLLSSTFGFHFLRSHVFYDHLFHDPFLLQISALLAFLPIHDPIFQSKVPDGQYEDSTIPFDFSARPPNLSRIGRVELNFLLKSKHHLFIHV